MSISTTSLTPGIVSRSQRAQGRIQQNDAVRFLKIREMTALAAVDLFRPLTGRRAVLGDILVESHQMTAATVPDYYDLLDAGQTAKVTDAIGYCRGVDLGARVIPVVIDEQNAMAAGQAPQANIGAKTRDLPVVAATRVGLAQADHIGAARTENFTDLGGIHDREQQVLHGHEFMSGFASRLEGFVQTDFEFAA